MDNNDKLIKKRKDEKRKRQIIKNRVILIFILIVFIVLLIFLIQRIVFSVIDYNNVAENSSVTQQDRPNINNNNGGTHGSANDYVVFETDNNINNETSSDSSSDRSDSSGETSSSTSSSSFVSTESSTSSENTNTPETPEVPASPEVSETANIDKTKWNLLLVNPWNKLPENFSVEKTTLKNGHSIDSRAYPYLQKMIDDARAEGLQPLICSSYRTVERQQQLFDAQVKKYLNMGYSIDDAEAEAAKWVAIPGTSEHHTALALDIVATSYQILDSSQEKTAEQKWLMANSYKYGFVLRYPKDKTDITGIVYEPWHYRFVGVEAAKEMYENKMCLEEYLSQ